MCAVDKHHAGRWREGGEAGSPEGSGSAGVAGSRTRSELIGGRRRVGLPKAGEAESSGTMGPVCGAAGVFMDLQTVESRLLPGRASARRKPSLLPGDCPQLA